MFGSIGFTGRQNLGDHLTDISQLDTSVYEEVQYEAQVSCLRHVANLNLRDYLNAHGGPGVRPTRN